LRYVIRSTLHGAMRAAGPRKGTSCGTSGFLSHRTDIGGFRVARIFFPIATILSRPITRASDTATGSIFYREAGPKDAPTLLLLRGLPSAMTTHVPVLVVGAGISGLVCAYSLRKGNIDAQLVEASPRPGGVIRSERRDGFLLELGPQSFSSTPQLAELCGDLGITDELVEAPPRAPRFLLLGSQLQQAPLSPPAFFASSLFSTKTKWSILRDAIGRSAPPYVDESVGAFMRRKFSAELLDKLVAPFVSGIYAGDPEKLSLRAAFPQLFEAERAGGSIIRGMLLAAKSKKGPKQRPTLQTFRAGNETLIKALVASLGQALRSEVSVSEIRRTNMGDAAKYQVTLTANGSADQIIADRLVLATPTHIAASLLPGVSTELASTLSSIEYAPIATVSLGYRKSDVGRSLEGFGFLVPRSAGLRTLGTVWNSSLFPGRAPDGHALFTSFIGGATDPQAVALSANELVALVHGEIAPLLQIHQSPTFSAVTLYPRALPQYNLGHSERLASLQKLRAELPGLWLAGNYLRGPSIGACLEQAQSVAEEIRENANR
jgi:oxygen-dependent protoporphyrinogen oxidase